MLCVAGGAGGRWWDRSESLAWSSGATSPGLARTPHAPCTPSGYPHVAPHRHRQPCSPPRRSSLTHPVVQRPHPTPLVLSRLTLSLILRGCVAYTGTTDVPVKSSYLRMLLSFPALLSLSFDCLIFQFSRNASSYFPSFSNPPLPTFLYLIRAQHAHKRNTVDHTRARTEVTRALVSHARFGHFSTVRV